MKKGKIFYCILGQPQYILNDYEIFMSTFDVFPFYYKSRGNLIGKIFSVGESLLKALIFVPKCDIVYSFFAAYHCFFPVIIGKLLGKKIVLSIGGFDAMSIPSIKYGIFCQKGLLPFIAKIIYRLADVILPVDKSLISTVNYYADPIGNGYHTGFLNHVSGITAKVKELHFGYDHTKYFHDQNIIRENKVLALSAVDNEEDYYRKGYDLIIDVAQKMPNFMFTLAGVQKKFIKKIDPQLSNVKIIGFVPHSEVLKLYSSHKVFLQPSLAEGQPNTLCEAMLCECIPIGSNVNGIPDVIGNTGFILDKKDVKKLEIFIKQAMSMKENCGKNARQRIIEHFPLSLREKLLKEYIES